LAIKPKKINKEKETKAKEIAKEKRDKEREKKNLRDTKSKEIAREKRERTIERNRLKREKFLEIEKEKKEKLKAKKELKKSKPVRARSAYTFFVKEQLPKLRTDGQKVAEIIKDVAAKWNGLSAEKKKSYLELAHKDVERKAKESKKWLKEHPKREPTGFAKFIKENFKGEKEKDSSLTVVDIMKKLAKKWKSQKKE